MKRKAPVRRNPVARVVRTLRQQKIQSAKAYRRRAKHMKARPDHDSQDGLFILLNCVGAITKIEPKVESYPQLCVPSDRGSTFQGVIYARRSG